jgi:hypothetical protein
VCVMLLINENQRELEGEPLLFEKRSAARALGIGVRPASRSSAVCEIRSSVSEPHVVL